MLARIKETSLKGMIVLWYECLDDHSYQGTRRTVAGGGEARKIVDIVKFFVGKKWRNFRKVTKIITDEKLMLAKIITDKVFTDKVSLFGLVKEKRVSACALRVERCRILSWYQKYCKLFVRESLMGHYFCKEKCQLEELWCWNSF